MALCVIVGMIYERYSPKSPNPAWIVWFAMLIPDSDFVAQKLWESAYHIKTAPIIHGDFHNILALGLSMFFIGWYIARKTKIRFRDTALCIGFGFTAHLLGDALVNGIVYHFYIPISSRGWYQGFIIPPKDDIIAFNTVIASSNILMIGTGLLLLMILIRTFFQGDEWLWKYKTIPATLWEMFRGLPATPLRLFAVFGQVSDINNEEEKR